MHRPCALAPDTVQYFEALLCKQLRNGQTKLQPTPRLNGCIVFHLHFQLKMLHGI